jgi:phospholipid/cholesterol/gamma-HCH transport system substrate-binding protein
MSGRLTTSAVDIDQLFNIFTPRTRAALRDVIQGQAAVYAGRGEESNETYRYLAPGLQSTTRLLAELTRDSDAFTGFLVEGARTAGAIAARRTELSSLIGNANEALGAVAGEASSLERALAALPGALRQANTTFVNLRGALDDLDPLVATAKPATRDLAPFLSDLTPVARRGVPVFGDLGRALHLPGKRNDLTNALRDLPGFQRRASAAVPHILDGFDASEPVLSVIRPYTPDLLGWLAKFGQVTAYYDANGHYARVQSANLDLFRVSDDESRLEPIPPSEQFDDLEFGLFTRCPGGATQPIEGSNPFTDDGALLGGGEPPNPKCDPDDVPPGP